MAKTTFDEMEPEPEEPRKDEPATEPPGQRLIREALLLGITADQARALSNRFFAIPMRIEVRGSGGTQSTGGVFYSGGGGGNYTTGIPTWALPPQTDEATAIRAAAPRMAADEQDALRESLETARREIVEHGGYSAYPPLTAEVGNTAPRIVRFGAYRYVDADEVVAVLPIGGSPRYVTEIVLANGERLGSDWQAVAIIKALGWEVATDGD